MKYYLEFFYYFLLPFAVFLLRKISFVCYHNLQGHILPALAC